jgi:hypothetical protein
MKKEKTKSKCDHGWEAMVILYKMQSKGLDDVWSGKLVMYLVQEMGWQIVSQNWPFQLVRRWFGWKIFRYIFGIWSVLSKARINKCNNKKKQKTITKSKSFEIQIAYKWKPRIPRVLIFLCFLSI